MVAYPFLAVGLIMSVVAVLFGLCSLVLIFIILIQKGRGGGLSAAFGGGGASSVLGSKTGDFLTWVTIILVGLFLLLAVIMGKFYRPGVSNFGGAATQQGQPAGDAEVGTATVGDTNLPSGESGS
ncbi:MAG: preprotein translocase subunit SecG [Sedimentisphaerales bacterium]|nr:preprotein translocase subunit SecG [Sedimentisphaerales bacterium]